MCSFRELEPNRIFNYQEKYGAMNLKMPGYPFVGISGKESATFSRLFVLKCLEEMSFMGYDFIISTNVSRYGRK